MITLMLLAGFTALASAGGPSTYGGKKCTIPFVYKGTEYNGCTKDSDSKPWCATGEKHYRVGSGEWAYCCSSLTDCKKNCDELGGYKKIDHCETCHCNLRNPCENGACGTGQCTVKAGKAVCSCKVNFQYNAQDKSCKGVDPCAGNPCGDHSTCSGAPGTGKHTCGCKSGYQRKGDKCVWINPCAANPCGEHSTCTAKEGSTKHTCGCEKLYTRTGSKCVYDFQVSQMVAGVFWTRGTGLKTYPYNYQQALEACKKQGATLASSKQLYFAWKAGMDVCACGWNSDKKVRYPIVTSLVSGCGGSKPGIRTCGWRSTYDAYCYKKPAAIAGVFPTGSGYKMNYNQAVAACKAKGAALASLRQLNIAYAAGMNHCGCGWTTDKKSHYPITYQTINGCGGSSPGVRTCGWRSTWDAFCYKVPSAVAGVFPTGSGYKMSYDQAVSACKAKGATLASANQLNIAYKNGMNHCGCGWTTDKKSHYPITYQTINGCGGSSPGVRTCGWRSTWDAFCYKKNNGMTL